MKLYKTRVELVASTYIFAENRADALALVDDLAGHVLDVSPGSRFISWSGDKAADINVQFRADMTFLGYEPGASLSEYSSASGTHPAIAERNSNFSEANFGKRGSKCFTAEAVLRTSALISAKSEGAARKRLSRLFSRSISVEDPCWLEREGATSRTFRLASETSFVGITGPLIEIAPQNGRDEDITDQVISNILAQASRDAALMDTLKAQVEKMRKAGPRNIGWMSESLMIEAILRTRIMQLYGREGSARSPVNSRSIAPNQCS